VNNLFKRILVAVVGIPFAVVVILLGGWVFTAVISILAAGTAYELIRLSNRLPVQGGPWKAAVFSAAMPVACWLWGAGGMLIFLLLVFLVFSITSLRHPPQQGFPHITLNLFAVVYSGVLFGAMILLRNSGTGGQVLNGGWLLLYAMAGVWIADSIAFFVGSSVGRRPLSPVLSPKKTWEGTIAGIFAAVAWGVWAPIMPEGLLSLPDRIVVGVLIGTMAVFGDLTESMMKRAVNLKDSGKLFPGHGGMLDRFDSLLVVLSSVYVYLVIRGIIPL